jgi:hypothetical protein
MPALTTPEQIDSFRVKVLLSAVGLYLKTGMRANRMLTPANMRAAVTGYTGAPYPASRKGLEKAYYDLASLVADNGGAEFVERIGRI